MAPRCSLQGSNRSGPAAAALLTAGLSFLVSPASAQELRSLFQQVKPSVVVIRTVGEELAPENEDEDTPVKLPRIGSGIVRAQEHELTETRVRGLGSGVLISADGKIVTAAHVVQTADEVEVQFVDGSRQRAKILSSAPDADVALLKVDRVPPAAHPANLGNSDPAQVGDRVFVVGAPFELSYTLTAGYISGRRAPEPLEAPWSSMELFQTDAAINKGNSGGPMFNLNGEVIGICSYILTQSGGFEGLGFVVTSNFARKVLLDNTGIWTGMDGLYLEDQLAELLNVPQRAGILVQRVAKNSPAAALGLRPGRYRVKVDDQRLVLGGDIILSVNGIPVSKNEGSTAEIERSLGQTKAGDPTRITVLRAGKIVQLEGKMLAEK